MLAATCAIGLLAGCGVIVGGGTLSEAPEEVGEGQVGMESFSGQGSGTLLLVPVYIGESGPYQFILDTGASRTVLDSGIVEELDLTTGRSAAARGVGSQFEGTTVEIDAWRVGDVELQPRTAVATDLSSDLSSAQQGPAFQGLLGSDVFAGFGVIEVDYDRQVLTLRGGQ